MILILLMLFKSDIIYLSQYNEKKYNRENKMVKTGNFESREEKIDSLEFLYQSKLFSQITFLSLYDELSKFYQNLQLPTPSELEKAEEVNKQAQIEWLNGKIGALKKAKFALSCKLNRMKFAIILWRKWFKGYQDRGVINIERKGLTFNVELKEVEENI